VDAGGLRERVDLNVAEKFSGDPRHWPFGPLRMNSYDFIMADPPWPMAMRSVKGEGKSFSRHYGAMSFSEIKALRVGDLAAPDCVLFLWAISPFILNSGDATRHNANPDASYSPIGACIKAWGFRYVGEGFWLKRTKYGKTAFGPGYWMRSAAEPWFLGAIGRPKHSKSARNVFEGLAREHSRKPEEAYAWAEAYMPNARRVELFSRTPRPGWDTWGYEAGKFEPVISLQARAA
jgi:N6-adenosine-specific RNA methylase IME4